MYSFQLRFRVWFVGPPSDVGRKDFEDAGPERVLRTGSDVSYFRRFKRTKSWVGRDEGYRERKETVVENVLRCDGKGVRGQRFAES